MLAVMKTGSRRKRPVRANGNTSAAKAIRWMSLSVPSGADGWSSIGQSMAMIRAIATIKVSGILRYLRMYVAYRHRALNTSMVVGVWFSKPKVVLDHWALGFR